MRTSTVEYLVEMNKKFYDLVAVSFDATRQSYWPGWYELLSILKPFEPLTLVDIGCGNGRFEQFLIEHKFQISLMSGLDNTHELINIANSKKLTNTVFTQHDVFNSLPNIDIETGTNVVVSFGVWHHIPGRQNRHDMLENLIQSVEKPGIVVVSLWHVTNKMTVYPPISDIEPGDLFIGWQNMPNLVRYCHQFNDEEISDLMKIPCDTVGRFEADGYDGKSNTYLYFIVR